jgi:hypothetical protein
MVYAQLMRTDPAFGSKVLALIDRATQLYFRACLDPARRAGAERLLTFQAYQTQIIMNTFAFTTLPASIAQLVSRPQAPVAAGTPTSSGPTTSVASGPPVFNPDRLPSFQANPDQVAILQNRVSSAPMWSYPHPPCRPCPRYHSGGECVTTCPRADTHRPPRDEEIAPYANWVQTRTRGPPAPGTSTAKQSGRTPARRPHTNQPRTGEAAPAKRSRANSPHPERTVQFASNPDF